MAIGTTAAIIGAAALGTAGSVVSGAMGAKASKQAAKAQESAALASVDVQREGLQFQKDQYAQTRQDYLGERQQARTDAMPWYEAGKTALTQYMAELNLGPGQSNFQATPGYKFAVKQGERSVMNNLNALGLRSSGSALKALTDYRTGVANQEYGNYLGRLAGVAGMGQDQANRTNQLGAQMSSQQGQFGAQLAGNVQQGLGNIGNTYESAGAARASGYVGAANALQNALGGATSNMSNALGMLSYKGFYGGGGLY